MLNVQFLQRLCNVGGRERCIAAPAEAAGTTTTATATSANSTCSYHNSISQIIVKLPSPRHFPHGKEAEGR